MRDKVTEEYRQGALDAIDECKKIFDEATKPKPINWRKDLKDLAIIIGVLLAILWTAFCIVTGYKLIVLIWSQP